MKNMKRIFTIVLAAALMTTTLCFTAFAADANEDKYAEARAAVDAVCFTSGSRGSAESTGIIGAAESTGTVFHPEQITDNVKWTLKDGVLILNGNGYMAKGGPSFNRYLEPFAKNEHIKTIIVGSNVKVNRNIFNTLPNLETVILLSNDSIWNAAVVNSHNLKTIITGADMTDTPIDLSDGRTLDGAIHYMVTIERMSGNRVGTTYVGAETSIAITSQVGNINDLAAQAKAALADAHMTDEAWAMIPKALGGTAGVATVDPMKDITVSNWAKDTVKKAIDANIVDLGALGKDYTYRINRRQFCALATKLYETVTGKTLTPTGSFDDTDDINVLKMASIGVIEGYGNGKFGPRDALTREQAAVILSRLSEAIGKPMTAGSPKFTDTASNWATSGINKCYGSGVMQGTSATTFSPKSLYTIEQSVVTMYRLMEYVNK